MATRKIATSTLWQIASQATMAGLSIMTVKFVAIGLSKELAGTYNSAYGYLQLFGILADFGLYAVAVREVSRAENKPHVLGAIVLLRTIILVLSLSIAIFFAWIVPHWQGTPLPLGITIAALVPFFTLLAGTLRTIFQVEYKMQYVFIAEVTQRIFTTAAIGAFILLGLRTTQDTQYYYLFLLFGGLGAGILFLFSLIFGLRLMPIHLQWDTAVLKRLLRSAAPYGLAFLCMALYRNFDVTLIALLRDDYELQNAYYGFVARMAEMGFLIPTFLLNSTLPILSERDERGEETGGLLGKTFLILLLLGSVSLLFSILWARPLVHLLTTDAYLSTPAQPGSDDALRLLSVPIFLNGIVLYSFYVMLTKHAWRPLVVSLLLGVGVSLIVNLALIPPFGFRGAALTSGLVHVFLSLALLPQALRLMPMRFSRRMAGQWLGFSALIGLGLWFLRPFLHSDALTAVGLAIMLIIIGLAARTCGLHRTLTR